MGNSSLYLKVGSESDFADILRAGGFDVAPMNEEPWATDKVSWQGFLCHRIGAIVGASIAIDKTGENDPFINIHTCRKFMCFFCRPSDVCLAHNVVEHLLKNGGRIAKAADD
jgi:hypothetical protein